MKFFVILRVCVRACARVRA